MTEPLNEVMLRHALKIMCDANGWTFRELPGVEGARPLVTIRQPGFDVSTGKNGATYVRCGGDTMAEALEGAIEKVRK